MLKKQIQRLYKNQFVRDRKLFLYWLKKRNWKKLKSFLWTRLFCFDQGGRYFDNIIGKFPFLVRYPKEFEIEVTTRCHLKCVICEHTHWDDRNYLNKDISFEQFKYVCEQFPKLHFINVTGEGTGILHKDFFKMLEYLAKRGVYILFVDSFDRFDPEKSKKVIELGVERIEVSLDAATKETYEKIRAGANWDNVINNLKALRDLKIRYKSPFPIIMYRYVVTTLNLSECVKFLDIVDEISIDAGMGQRRVEFCDLLTFEKVNQYKVNKVPEEIIEDTYKRGKELNIDIGWAHFGHSMEPVEKCIKWKQPYIVVTGDVILDCALVMSDERDKLSKSKLGNVFDQSFEDIWYAERYKKIRENVNKSNKPIPAFCVSCRAYTDHCNRSKKYGLIE